MDSPDIKEELEETEEEEVEVEVEVEKRKKSSLYIFFGALFKIFFTIWATFSLSFVVVFVAVVLGNLSIWNPISIPSQCKILSSSVDLRSSKVCELGLLNYRAKHVFYPYESKKFRCRYDYYWASVFEVEYVDRAGQRRLALAEAPNEALPSNCRPTFGAAWLTKDKFKVNETYDCWYTLGISRVDMPQDGLFNCQANDPSSFEMLRRYSIVSMRILKSWITSSRPVGHWRLDVVAGVMTGFCTSLVTVGLASVLHQLKSSLHGYTAERMHLSSCAVYIKRACFFIAYFSFMGCLALMYLRRIGLPQMSGMFATW